MWVNVKGKSEREIDIKIDFRMAGGLCMWMFDGPLSCGYGGSPSTDKPVMSQPCCTDSSRHRYISGIPGEETILRYPC